MIGVLCLYHEDGDETGDRDYWIAPRLRVDDIKVSSLTWIKKMDNRNIEVVYGKT